MNFIGKLSSLFASEVRPKADHPHGQRLQQVVETVDPALAKVPNYGDVLLPAINHAVAYFDRVAGAIPGPVGISAEAHAWDEPVRVLFPSPDDIHAGLGRSLSVRSGVEPLKLKGCRTLFALMGTRQRHESPAAEGAQDGGAALSDHTFFGVAAGEEEVREMIRDAAFESLVKAFYRRVDQVRSRRELVASEKDLHAQLHRDRQGKGDGAGFTGSEILEAHLSLTEKELSPERLLGALCEWLHQPEAFLKLHGGAELHGDIPGKEERPVLRLPLLSSQDRRQWLVCLTHFPIQEAVVAMEKEKHAHRFILI